MHYPSIKSIEQPEPLIRWVPEGRKTSPSPKIFFRQWDGRAAGPTHRSDLVLLLTCWGSLCVIRGNLPLPDDLAATTLIPSNLGRRGWCQEGAHRWEGSPWDPWGQSSVPPAAHRSVSTKTKPGFPGLDPFGAWKPPRMDTAQPLSATSCPQN